MSDNLKERLLLMTTGFTRNAVVMGLSLILQLYMTGLGSNIFWVGVVSALGGIGTILFSPVWGSLSDKGERKFYLIISSMIALIFLLFYPLAPNFILIIFFVFLFSSANAGFVPIATTFASEKSKRRGIEVSFFNSALSFGNFMGMVIIGVLTIWLSVKMSLWVFVLVFALSILPIIWIKEDKSKVSIRTVHRGLLTLDDLSFMKENHLGSIYISAFLRQIGVSGVTSIAAVYFVYDAHLPLSLVGFLAGLNPLVQIFSTLFFARIAETKNSKISVMLGMAITTASILSFAIFRDVFGVGLAYGLLGLGFGAFISGSTTYISFTVSSDLRGRFMGLFTSFRSFGTVVGSFLGGIIALMIGYHLDFLFMAIAVGMAYMIVWLFFKENPVLQNAK